jgi:hypothetical protein
MDAGLSKHDRFARRADSIDFSLVAPGEEKGSLSRCAVFHDASLMSDVINVSHRRIV